MSGSKMSDWTNVRLDKCQIGQMSDWANVMGDKCKIGQKSGLNECPVGLMADWTNPGLDKFLVGQMIDWTILTNVCCINGWSKMNRKSKKS